MNKEYCFDGVTVYTEKTDKFNSSVICFLIRQPALKERATINSLLIRILGSSCKKYNTPQKLNIQLEELYGANIQYNIVKKGYEQLLELSVQVKPGLEEEITGLLSELIFNPNITEETIAVEKKKLRDYLINKANDKKELALEKCIENMCNNGFGVCCDGYIEDINEIDKNMLICQYNKLLTTAPIEIMAMGNFNFDCLKALIPKNRKPTPIKYNNTVAVSENINIIEESSNVTQTKLCIGLKTKAELPGDYFKLMVYNELLGGNASSRLFAYIREKQGLCYYINSLFYSLGKIMVIQSGIDYKSSNIVINAVKDIMNNINNDLELPKKQLISYYKALYDSPMAFIDFNLNQMLLGTNYTVDEVIKGIEDVKDITNIRWYIDTIYILTGENNGENINKKTEKRNDALCYS